MRRLSECSPFFLPALSLLCFFSGAPRIEVFFPVRVFALSDYALLVYMIHKYTFLLLSGDDMFFLVCHRKQSIEPLRRTLCSCIRSHTKSGPQYFYIYLLPLCFRYFFPCLSRRDRAVFVDNVTLRRRLCFASPLVDRSPRSALESMLPDMTLPTQ